MAFYVTNIVTTPLFNLMKDQWMSDNMVVYIKKELPDNIDNETIMKTFGTWKIVMVDCNYTCENIVNQISKYIFLICSLNFLSPTLTKIHNYVPGNKIIIFLKI